MVEALPAKPLHTRGHATAMDRSESAEGQSTQVCQVMLSVGARRPEDHSQPQSHGRIVSVDVSVECLRYRQSPHNVIALHRECLTVPGSPIPQHSILMRSAVRGEWTESGRQSDEAPDARGVVVWYRGPRRRPRSTEIPCSLSSCITSMGTSYASAHPFCKLSERCRESISTASTIVSRPTVVAYYHRDYDYQVSSNGEVARGREKHRRAIPYACCVAGRLGGVSGRHFQATGDACDVERNCSAAACELYWSLLGSR